jgi:putative DNA-invertase from lambdoid prophage Rac
VNWAVLGSIAEFERVRIQERVMAGLQRARKAGKRLGRPRRNSSQVTVPRSMTVREAAVLWGVSPAIASRWINDGRTPLDPSGPGSA